MYYIINEKFIEFAKEKECLDNFSPCHKHCQRPPETNSYHKKLLHILFFCKLNEFSTDNVVHSKSV